MVQALTAVLKPGLGRSQSIAKERCLTERLWVVRREAKSDEPSADQWAAAFRRALTRVVSRRLGTLVEEEQSEDRDPTDPRAGALSLFGLTTKTRGKSLPDRHKLAAAAFGRSYGVFMRRYRQPLIEDVAQVLIDAEVDRRTELRRIQQQAKGAETYAVAQTEADFRVYLQFHQACAALARGLRPLAGHWRFRIGNDDATLGRGLYELARTLAADQVFLRKFSGRRLGVSGAEDELFSAHSCIRGAILPFNDIEASQLRTAYASLPGQEIYPFLAWIRTDTTAQELFQRWCAWVETCQCEGPEDLSGCHLHRLLNAASVIGNYPPRLARQPERPRP